jgi:hypothetical protein
MVKGFASMLSLLILSFRLILLVRAADADVLLERPNVTAEL